jgi:hypothetical protein
MDMATRVTEVSRAGHERQAKRADELLALTQARYRRSLSRKERAESLARHAETDEERERQMRLALLHREAARCHQGAASLFKAHRDHGRAHSAR